MQKQKVDNLNVRMEYVQGIGTCIGESLKCIKVEEYFKCTV